MIKDSGNRTEFSTGAVRDVNLDKGRCDLLPLKEVSELLDAVGWSEAFTPSVPLALIILEISKFKGSKSTQHLYNAAAFFVENTEMYRNTCDAILELSLHFGEGCAKYGENNWQKGIPISRYMDSALRHLLKFCRGDCDERHDRAYLWNIMCAIWTMRHKPEMDDFTGKDGSCDVGDTKSNGTGTG